MNKLFDVYLKTFLLGTMVFYLPNQLAYVPQELFFQYGAIGFFFLSLIVPARRVISNWYLGVLLFYLLLNALVIHTELFSKAALMNIFFGSVVIKIVAERVNLDFKSLGKFFTVFCVVNILQLTLQVLNVDPVFTMVNSGKTNIIDCTGFLNARFALASVATLMLPFMYAANPLYIIAAIPLLWFGKSSACLGAATLASLFLLWKTQRKWFWIIAGAVLLASLCYIFFYDFPSGQFTKRFPVWWKGIEIMRGTPWFGVGLGSWAKTGFTTIQLNGEPEQWMQAHNDFIQFLFEAGVVGAISLWVWLRGYFVKNPIVVSAFLSILVISFFHFPFHIARLAGISCFILASAEACRADH